MSAIDIDFKKAKAEADKLEIIVNEMEKMINNDYEATMRQVREGWKGEAGEAFLNKGGVLESDMRYTAKQLREVLNELRGIIKAVELLQKQAQEIVNRKNY